MDTDKHKDLHALIEFSCGNLRIRKSYSIESGLLKSADQLQNIFKNLAVDVFNVLRISKEEL